MDPATITTGALVLLAISEGLSLIPALKSNGIFQVLYLILTAVVKGIKSKEV